MGKSGKNAKDKRAGGKGQSSRFYVLNGKKIAGGQGIGNKSTNTGSAGSNLSNIKIRTGSSGLDCVLTGGASSINDLTDALVESNSIYLGNDPSNTTNTAQYNVAVGITALDVITTGDKNVAVGHDALTLNTTGSENTASGSGALYSNTTGNKNTASGIETLYSNTTGSQNTASGFRSLYLNTTGGNNTASGIETLYSNTTGNHNTASGFQALYANTTGDSNTASGFRSLYSNTTGNYNTASGDSALYSNTTGSQNTASGYEALRANTTGINNTAIGHGADVALSNLTNATAIGYNASVNGSNTIRLGNTSVSVIEGQVAFTAASDKRIKKNIIDGDLGLDFITKLRPVKYNMVNPADYPEELLEKRFKGETPDKRPEDNSRVYDGLIAQEVEETLKKMNKTWSGHNIGGGEGKQQSLAYSSLTMPLIKAVQQLNDRLITQESEIIELKKIIQELKK